MKKIVAWQNLNSSNHKIDNGLERQISNKLGENIEFIKKVLGGSNDIKIHEFIFGEEFEGAIIYIDGLVNNTEIRESILKPIVFNKKINKENEELSIKEIQKSIICSGDIKRSDMYSVLIDGCLAGATILLINGFRKGLVINTGSWEKRAITEPQTEPVVRGPREGFTEDLRTNTSLLRRRIKSPKFKMENMIIGRKTYTNICIAYIEGLAKPELIKTLRYRLNNLDVDSIIDSSYIEEYIEDYPLSIFATIGYSEKPDVVAAKILEGRVGIIVDGSPFVLTAPMLFVEGFQSSEDYYVRAVYASILRIMRFFAYFVAVYAVPLFIALTTFHQELLPTTFLFSIANAREGTPFPAFIEGLIMVISFEILREAGLRLPRPVGQAISIVGALIMGEAAVSAGIVGAPMVITVAIAAVAGFIIPDQTDSISILRIIMMVLATVLGGYGLAIGFLAVLIHLSILEPFGIPYFASIKFTRDKQDSFTRMPLWIMKDRPKELSATDVKRRDTYVPPDNKDD
ncbi:MAG: spore germination protein [Tissierella sp.]|nr:spore germination protein [Tissierella sp.]